MMRGMLLLLFSHLVDLVSAIAVELARVGLDHVDEEGQCLFLDDGYRLEVTHQTLQGMIIKVYLN
jgi:hypothetical protein